MAYVRCSCMQCVVGGMRGPVMLILLGSLFLIDKWNLLPYTFWDMAPGLLIVFGLMKVAEALAPSDGHLGGMTTGNQPTPGQPGTGQPGMGQ